MNVRRTAPKGRSPPQPGVRLRRGSRTPVCCTGQPGSDCLAPALAEASSTGSGYEPFTHLCPQWLGCRFAVAPQVREQ